MSNSIELETVPDLLYACCMKDQASISFDEQQYIRDEYNKIGKESVYAYAKTNKVLPYFAHTFINAECDVSYWKSIHSCYSVRNEEVITLLNTLYIELGKQGVDDVFVAENFGSILSSGVCVGCFCSGDIDFYVQEKDIEKIDKVVVALGYSWSNRHKKKKSFAREYCGVLPSGEDFWLNFQWKPMTRKKTHLYDQRAILRRYPLLLQETELFENTQIKIFKPEAALYLNCVHIASGHYYILMPKARLYADVDRPIRYRQVDWSKFNRWIEDDDLGIRADTVLMISKILLDTPVPDVVFSNAKKELVKNFVNSLVDIKTKKLKLPDNNKIKRTLFLVRTELYSDGTGYLLAFLRRFWVILSEKD